MKQARDITWVWLASLALLVGTNVAEPPTASSELIGTKSGGPCTVIDIKGKFWPDGAQYTASGTCGYSAGYGRPIITVPFTAQGGVQRGRGPSTKEKLKIKCPYECRELRPGERPNGEITTVWNCFGTDKWLDPPGTSSACHRITTQTQGQLNPEEVERLYGWNEAGDLRPVSSWLSPALRAALIEQRNYALDPQRRLEAPVQGASPPPVSQSALTINVPQILSPPAAPAPNSYRAQSPVTIRITPPPQVRVQNYALEIQKKNAQGMWERVTTVPVVSAAEAEGTGFMKFGPHQSGTPIGSGMTTNPGSWRLRAQVTNPIQTKWSQWREFSVVPADSPRLMTDIVQPAAPITQGSNPNRFAPR